MYSQKVSSMLVILGINDYYFDYYYNTIYLHLRQERRSTSVKLRPLTPPTSCICPHTHHGHINRVTISVAIGVDHKGLTFKVGKQVVHTDVKPS